MKTPQPKPCDSPILPMFNQLENTIAILPKHKQIKCALNFLDDAIHKIQDAKIRNYVVESYQILKNILFKYPIYIRCREIIGTGSECHGHCGSCQIYQECNADKNTKISLNFKLIELE